MARYFSATVFPEDEEGLGVGVSEEEAAETKDMGFLQRPRPKAGCWANGAVEMSASASSSSSSSAS